MRGAVTKTASVVSDNSLSFGFPYGDTTGTIVLRRNPALNVLLKVDSGQFLCDDYGHSTVSVKFDDKPIEHYSCAAASDGRTNEIFLNGESRFVGRLRHASKVVIEAEFYQSGTRQLTFTVAGLDWK